MVQGMRASLAALVLCIPFAALGAGKKKAAPVGLPPATSPPPAVKPLSERIVVVQRRAGEFEQIITDATGVEHSFTSTPPAPPNSARPATRLPWNFLSGGGPDTTRPELHQDRLSPASGLDEPGTPTPATDGPREEATRDHTVRLVYDDATQYCTGTLIASSWVLTAGHCVANTPTAVGIGASLSLQILVDVDDCRLSPDNGLTADTCGTFTVLEARVGMHSLHDLALLHLKQSVGASQAAPASLGRAPHLSAGTSLRLSGFGNTALASNGGCPAFVSEPPTIRQSASEKLLRYDDEGMRLAASAPGVIVSVGDSGGPVFAIDANAADADVETLLGVSVQSDCFAHSTACPVFDNANASWLERNVPDAVWSPRNASDASTSHEGMRDE